MTDSAAAAFGGLSYSEGCPGLSAGVYHDQPEPPKASLRLLPCARSAALAELPVRWVGPGVREFSVGFWWAVPGQPEVRGRLRRLAAAKGGRGESSPGHGASAWAARPESHR